MALSKVERKDLPACAFYNIRFLGLSSSEAWGRKLASVRGLVSRAEIVCISETHVTEEEGEQFFFEHVQGVRTHH